jgi:hypothetical protein
MVGQDPAKARVSFAGFADVYYAYDFGRPLTFDRAFTTQPARHSEFNVNLAHIEAKLEGDGVRARLALQAGTAVQSNYSAEPSTGSVSGPTLARHIQEAVIGVRLGSQVWIDGGIFLSHIGAESWISRDNPTYTRSLIADYSPYYQAGAKLTWTPSSTVTAQLNVVNGWQIISENNVGKSAGLRVDVVASPKVTLSAYNLIGNELPAGTPARTRIFHGASIKVTPDPKSVLLATFDFGFQDGAPGNESSKWYGGALIGRYQVSGKVGVAARVERYSDPDEVIVVTGTPNGFKLWGGSFGVDVAPTNGVIWRTELRAFGATDPIFPKRDATGGVSKGNGFVVTSLGVTF